MNKIAIIEGLLFVMGEEGISISEMEKVLNVRQEEIEELLLKLEDYYNSPSRGIQLKKFGDKYKFTTKQEHLKYYEIFFKEEVSNTLTQAALETLIIIAYNQPTTRLEVDEARGVYSGPMIRKLVLQGLVEICGKKEAPGRPNLYQTTNLFLDYFGLTSIEELPKIEIEKQDKEIDLYQ